MRDIENGIIWVDQQIEDKTFIQTNAVHKNMKTLVDLDNLRLILYVVVLYTCVNSTP